MNFVQIWKFENFCFSIGSILFYKINLKNIFRGEKPTAKNVWQHLPTYLLDIYPKFPLKCRMLYGIFRFGIYSSLWYYLPQSFYRLLQKFLRKR